MKTNTLQYKGYQGTIEFDLEEKCIFGSVLHINDLVTYEAETLTELEEEFKTSVDDYLSLCKDLGKEPQKPFKGSFNIRISPDKHKRLATKAAQKASSINELVSLAIDRYLENDKMETPQNHKIEFKFVVENPKVEEPTSDIPVLFKTFGPRDLLGGEEWKS
ncbi:MAG: type II toxin-antitoxin system HicB family antitoxin [Bacteroidales bacterium]|nr:type II toxin-antitoxin system HicB family antitoxin [Bacteroidales bacterium]